MFSLMGNCISCVKQRREPKREVTLAILGLDGAGKTTITKALLGALLETAPTVGFNKEEITFSHYAITLYDLGGGKRIRDIWRSYLAEVYGVVYVVDSASRDRVAEVRDNLQQLLEHSQVTGKPLLILANKQDMSGHMDEVDVCQKLDIEKLVNVNKCPCKMVMCSAIKGSGKAMDSAITDGMNWMCSLLDQLYDSLKVRIDSDVNLAATIHQEEAAARKARVKKIKEERERKEEEERKKLGIEKEEEEEEDIKAGGPWKRLDSEEVKRQEDRYKKAKQKEKERTIKLKELEEKERAKDVDTNVNADNDDDLPFRAPRSTRSLLSYGLQNGGSNHNNSARLSDNDDIDSYIPHSYRNKLPPLQSPLGTKFVEENPDKNHKRNKKQKNHIEHLDNKYESHHSDTDKFEKSSSSVSRIHVMSIDSNEDEALPMSEITKRNNSKNKNVYVNDDDLSPTLPDNGRKKKGKKKSSRFSSEVEDFDTLRRSQHLEEDVVDCGEENLAPSHRQGGIKLKPLQGPEYKDPERSTTPVKKLKKKKHHLRKNKLAPSDDEFEASDPQNTPKKKPVPWVKATTSPHTPLTNGDYSGASERWNLAEDIGDIDQLQPVTHSRPNFDDNTVV